MYRQSAARYRRGCFWFPGDRQRVQVQNDQDAGCAFRVLRVCGTEDSDCAAEMLAEPCFQLTTPVLRGMSFLED